MEQPQGCYLYCVADGGEEANLGRVGLEGREVYTIPYADISAVVHSCPAQPYQSQDRQVIEAWVVAHHRVVNLAWERWGTVLPMTFDTIIAGETETEARGNVQAWLGQEYSNLQSKLARVRGKAEFGIQVFWEPETRVGPIQEDSPPVAPCPPGEGSPGRAYLSRLALERRQNREFETMAQQRCQELCRCLQGLVDALRVESTRKAGPGLLTLMNLSCLVAKDRASSLKEELERVQEREKMQVRLTGPWPVYSFVNY